MKRQSRDINVFSISALDLFASALGAFILLTVIFLPFFPNTGDHPKVSEAILNELEQAKADNTAMAAEIEDLNGKLADAEASAAAADAAAADAAADAAAAAAAAAAAQAEASKVQFPDIDLVIALDTTGSMSDSIDGLRSEISQFAVLMEKLTPSFGLGLIDFKDRCQTSNALNSFRLVEINASTLAQAQRFANGMSPGGQSCNDTNPEAVELALDAAIDMPWRSQAKLKVIVIITDNPAFPELVNRTLSDARGFAGSGSGRKVSTVYVRTGDYAASGAAPNADAVSYLRDLAEAGGGEFVSNAQSFTTSMLLALTGI